ncbi:MAG: YicC family protein [Gemmatimonadetes bacterium]|nr:YicC family protein [Gemmatimonadota bacterium]
MTGYGEAERETPLGWLRGEIKTVNHRFFSANVRLPLSLERHEPHIREWLRTILPRGHVSYSLRLEMPDSDSGEAPALRLDEGRARQYLRVLRLMQERLQLPGEIDVALLSRFGDLIVRADAEEAEGVVLDDVRAVTEAAARAAVLMREEEGARLRNDLDERLQAIETTLRGIEARAPERLVAERDRLRRAIAELAGDTAVEEERLVQEVAYLAERWDISEELVRLRAHVQLFRDLLDSGSAEPVGKRLGFLNQEMNREANTIGSKANDAVIEHQVVAIKNEIERLREQIENVE